MDTAHSNTAGNFSEVSTPHPPETLSLPPAEGGLHLTTLSPHTRLGGFLEYYPIPQVGSLSLLPINKINESPSGMLSLERVNGLFFVAYQGGAGWWVEVPTASIARVSVSPRDQQKVQVLVTLANEEELTLKNHVTVQGAFQARQYAERPKLDRDGTVPLEAFSQLRLLESPWFVNDGMPTWSVTHGKVTVSFTLPGATIVPGAFDRPTVTFMPNQELLFTLPTAFDDGQGIGPAFVVPNFEDAGIPNGFVTRNGGKLSLLTGAPSFTAPFSRDTLYVLEMLMAEGKVSPRELQELFAGVFENAYHPQSPYLKNVPPGDPQPFIIGHPCHELWGQFSGGFAQYSMTDLPYLFLAELGAFMKYEREQTGEVEKVKALLSDNTSWNVSHLELTQGLADHLVEMIAASFQSAQQEGRNTALPTEMIFFGQNLMNPKTYEPYQPEEALGSGDLPDGETAHGRIGKRSYLVNVLAYKGLRAVAELQKEGILSTGRSNDDLDKISEFWRKSVEHAFTVYLDPRNSPCNSYISPLVQEVSFPSLSLDISGRPNNLLSPLAFAHTLLYGDPSVEEVKRIIDTLSLPGEAGVFRQNRKGDNALVFSTPAWNKELWSVQTKSDYQGPGVSWGVVAPLLQMGLKRSHDRIKVEEPEEPLLPRIAEMYKKVASCSKSFSEVASGMELVAVSDEGEYLPYHNMTDSRGGVTIAAYSQLWTWVGDAVRRSLPDGL